MEQSYWNNKLWSLEFKHGSASSVSYNINFFNPITVNEFIEILDGIKAKETNKRDFAHGNVYISEDISKIFSKDIPIVAIEKDEDKRLPDFEEYKDKIIKKARCTTEWSLFTFYLECED